MEYRRHQNAKSHLWDSFVSSAHERLRATTSTMGPGAPQVASMTSSSEVHIQRMPRSYRKLVKDMLPIYRQHCDRPQQQQQQQNEHLESVIETLFDKAAEKLPDGSRLFQALTCALALELSDHPHIRGLLAQGDASRAKVASAVRSSELRDDLLLSAILQPVLEEVSFINPSTLVDDDAAAALAKKACCETIARCETGSANGKALASVAAALASGIVVGTSSRDDVAADRFSLSHITELAGLSTSNSKVLPVGTVLLPVAAPVCAASSLMKLLLSSSSSSSQQQNTNNNNATTTTATTSRHGVRLLLVRRLDFIGFGGGRQQYSNLADDDESSSSSLSSTNSCDDDDDIGGDGNVAGVRNIFERRHHSVSMSLSQIVEPYRQQVELSAADPGAWLSHLAHICSSQWLLHKKKKTTKNEDDCKDDSCCYSSLVILTCQHLPEAVHQLNTMVTLMGNNNGDEQQQVVSIVDGIDPAVMKCLENVSGAHSCVVPLRPDDIDVCNSFVLAERMSEVKLPPAQQQASQSTILFELVGLRKEEHPNSAAAVLGLSRHNDVQTYRCAVACGPTPTIARSLKKLTAKLVRCLGFAATSSSFHDYVRGGFVGLLTFARHCRRFLLRQQQQPLETDNKKTDNKLFTSLIECAAAASMQVVVSLLLAASSSQQSASSSSSFRHRNSAQLALLRDPDSFALHGLVWSDVGGCWEVVTGGGDQTTKTMRPAAAEPAVVDFAWVLPQVVSSSLEMLALILGCDQVVAVV